MPFNSIPTQLKGGVKCLGKQQLVGFTNLSHTFEKNIKDCVFPNIYEKKWGGREGKREKGRVSKPRSFGLLFSS